MWSHVSTRLAASLLAAALLLVAAPARAEDIGVTVGPTFGGGTLPGGALQVQVSRPLFLTLDVGYRAGLVIGGRYYPNAALSLGVTTQFGERPWRNGVFGKVGTTLPLGFYEAWAAAGWASREWSRPERVSVTVELGPAVYLVRRLPPETGLGQIPVFLYLGIGLHFPVIVRHSNAPTAPSRRDERRRGTDSEELGPV